MDFMEMAYEAVKWMEHVQRHNSILAMLNFPVYVPESWYQMQR
jgi:hypothetical protein